MRTAAQATSIDAYHAHVGSGKAAGQRERILAFIKEHGGAWSIGELARALNMEKSTVSARRWELINETGELEIRATRRDRISGIRIQPAGVPSIQLSLFQ